MNNRRFGILIASSQYAKDTKLESLRCPENDVDGLNEILTSKEIGLFTQTFVLKNLPHNEVLYKINEVLLNQVERDDLVLIYYSGHGKLNRKGRLHLATVDTETKVLDTTSISVESLRHLIDISSVSKVILILDCCYSGRIGDVFFKSSVDDYLQQVSDARGLYVLTASTAIQVAQEKEGDSYSLLTKHILEGIRGGKADYDDDGYISINDVYRYASERMQHHGIQEPMKWDINITGTDLLIARAGKLPKERRQEEIKNMLLDLYQKGGIPTTLLSKGLEINESDPDRLSPKDKMYFELLIKRHQTRLTVGELIEKWYRVERMAQAQIATYLGEAALAFASENWNAAIEKLRAILELEPGHTDASARLNHAQQQLSEQQTQNAREQQLRAQVEAYIGEAESAIDNEDWDTAVRKLEALLKLEPLHAEAIAKLAHTRQQQQRKLKMEKEEARQARTASLLRDAEIALNKEEWQVAIEILNTLLNLEPEHEGVMAKLTFAQQNRTRQLQEEQRQDQIASYFSEAKKDLSNEKWLSAIDKLRSLLELEPDYAEARVEFHRAVRRQTEEHRHARIAVYLGEADIALANEDWNAAIEKLETVLDLEQGHADALARLDYAQRQLEQQLRRNAEEQRGREQLSAILSEAEEALRNEAWSVAVEKFETFLEREPGHLEALSKLAYARQKLKQQLNRDRAERHKTAAYFLRLGIGLSDLWKQLRYRRGSFLILILVLSAVVIWLALFSSRSSTAYFAEGMAYYSAGDFDLAIRKFDQAIKLDGNNVDAYFNRGLACYSRKDFDSAAESFTRILNIDPHYSEAYLNRALAYMYGSRPDMAMNDFNEAVRLSPNNPQAYFNRGLAYYQRRDFGSAVENFTRAVGIDQKYSDAYCYIGLSNLELGRHVEALKAFSTAISTDSNASLAYSRRGEIYYKIGRIEEALNDYNRSIALGISESRTYNNRGLALLKKDNVNAALADFDQAINLDPAYPHSYFNQGLALYKKGNFEGAKQSFTTAIHLNPLDAMALDSRGDALDKLGKFDEAITDFEQAIKLKPDLANAYFNLGLAYKKKGERDKSKKYFNLFRKKGGRLDGPFEHLTKE